MRLLMSIGVLLLICMGPLTAAAQQAEAQAAPDISIIFKGKEVKLEDPVRMLDERLFLPVASLTGMLGMNATWDPDHEAVTIHKPNGDQIILSNGVPVVYLNEIRYLMEVAPFLAEGRMYIPLRYAAELMNTSVHWDSEEQIVELVALPSEEQVLSSLFSNEAKPFTEKDLKLLAKLTQVEAGYESYEGQLAIANVVLNRVKNPRFPSSIYDVIYSGKQFPVAHNGMLDKSKPNASVLRAAKDALDGKNNIEDAIYFYNPKVTSGSFWSNLKVIDTIGNHRFAK